MRYMGGAMPLGDVVPATPSDLLVAGVVLIVAALVCTVMMRRASDE